MLGSCGSVGDLDWGYRLEVEGAVTIEALIFRGPCDDREEVFRTRFDREGIGDAPPTLDDGTHCFVVRAIGAGCTVIGEGELEQDLPALDPVIVAVRGRAPSPFCEGMETCVAGACVPPGEGECGDCCSGDRCVGGQCVPALPVSSIAAGRAHTCATRGGELWCWGTSESNGEVGTNQANALVNLPTRVGDLPTRYERVSSAFRSSCAISDNDLWCWGLNGDDQLGLGPEEAASVILPTMHPRSGVDFERIQMGHFGGCGLASDHSVYCWGYNGQGQAGPSEDLTVPRPTRIDGRQWDDITVGRRFVCGIRNGQLFCWGQGVYGELGTGVVEAESRAPQQVSGEWRSVRAGSNHACAIDEDARLFCWGHGDATDRIETGEDVDATGALGLGDVGRATEPADTGLREIDRVAAWNHTCAIDRQGAMSCFGPNVHGELGVGDTVPRLTPARVPGRWRFAEAGQDHTCAVDDVGALWCWGRNDRGALGTGDRADRGSPVRICF